MTKEQDLTSTNDHDAQTPVLAFALPQLEEIKGLLMSVIDGSGQRLYTLE